MNFHLLLLLYAIGIIVIAIIFFYPDKGLASRWRRSNRNNKKILIEDAIKNIYVDETEQNATTVYSLLNCLKITKHDAMELVSQLRAMNLIRQNGNDKINLTETGRSEALRIVRSHRLWEKFLEVKTGLSETDWHTSAEEKEHTLSESEVDELAASLNNPIYDPHGDPIPQADGSVVSRKGILLTDLPEGNFAHISHIEDEPETIYAQIVAQGLYPDMQVQVISKNNDRIKFAADGNECLLAPLFAKNISVVPIETEEEINLNFKNLSELKIGERAEVAGIAGACRGQQRRRLLDLGVVPGTIIKALRSSALGDPVAYELRGSVIALRKKHASYIFIK